MNYNPKYEINLKAVFDRAYSGQAALGAKLWPTLKSPEFRRIYSTRIIDKIVDRTLEGVDKDNRPFVSYTEEYKKSLKYRAYGKQGNVNLRLTGSMLADLKSSDNFNTIIINLGSQKNKNKADGHVTGGRGKWSKNGGLRKRDFLGLPKEEEADIMREVLKDMRAESLVVQADLFDSFAALGILENIGVGGISDLL